MKLSLSICLIALLVIVVSAEDKSASPSYFQPGQIEQLTQQVKPAVVTVRQIGRDGDRRGVGSGFVIDAEKRLVATNLHVIGEGRPVEVEFTDGEVYRVQSVHSWDAKIDMAVLQIDSGDRQLQALEIGDSKQLKQGQLIVGFGAPMGLKFSVVSGVVSAIRKLDEDFLDEDEMLNIPMIQLAMPIEQGNSGGPVVNLNGEVMGIVALKHRIQANLGFAVPSAELTAILEKPNTVAMSRWVTIGALDPRQWTILMNGDWTQRGGTLMASNPGSGFGGRTLCLSEQKIPSDGAYEIAVRVRLDDESGAAGIAFGSDGADRHYGFYPSGGQLRLTRFDGPDVYSWNILEQLPVDAYLPGEWNRLRVRIDGDLITGYVNGVEVLSLDDGAITNGGKVGLCKFRQTNAEFREFRLGSDLQAPMLTDEMRTAFDTVIDGYLAEGDSSLSLDSLVETGDAQALGYLEEKAAAYEEMAEKMRQLKSQLHQRRVADELQAAIAGAGDASDIDLFEVALQIARIDDPSLDLSHYRSVFERLVADSKDYVGDVKGKAAVRKLRDFLFRESGFHGSRQEYYHHANSYINHVLDDREGLPITLSILYIEIARRLDISGIYGVALPGQFLVGFRQDPNQPLLLLDVFDSGQELTQLEAERLAASFGYFADESVFEPSPPLDIAKRMLRNLIGIELDKLQNPPGALGYLDLMLAIDPESAQQRFQRALVLVQTKQFEAAKRDLDWLLDSRPPGINYQRLEMFRSRLP